jgi:hypothetical protein
MGLLGVVGEAMDGERRYNEVRVRGLREIEDDPVLWT